MMVGGLGSSVTQAQVDAIPLDPFKFGAAVRHNVVVRSPDKRRTGEPAHWETSVMAQNAQVYGERALG